MSIIKPLLLIIAACTFCAPAFSAEVIAQPAVISIIIDDIGYREHDDLRAIGLNGQVTYAIMPHSPHAVPMSHLANRLGKDVIVHMPMQAIEEENNKFLGPGALTLEMTEQEFKQAIDSNLQSVPHAVGVNNHMGSLLTRHPGHMKWLLESLHEHNKFYLDSVTSNQTIARYIAKERNVPYLRRDVFLDNKINSEYISKQFDELIRVAKLKGRAIGIGHPHPETINVLSKKLHELKSHNIKLISLKEMMAKRYQPAFHKVSLSDK